jgi:CIC family chloride channel protein
LTTLALALPNRFRRWANALRTSSSGLLVLSLLVGAGAAGFAVFFRWLIAVVTTVLTGYADYTEHTGAPHPGLTFLGGWFVLFTPVVAGLVYGPMVHFFAREARGHGVPEVMYAVQKRGGRIAPQVAVVKALASGLTIGGGGSVGREGPIVQIGSALGSTFGGFLRVTEPRRRVLVACGAAGGIAATFNAPLAGVFFAMELILADFTAEAFGMVVLASVTSSVIGRAILGDSPFLQLPHFYVTDWREYFFFALLGIMAGAIGVLFTKVLYWFEDAADAIWKWPEWARPAVGGLLLGLLLVALPQMYGVGYPILANGVAGKYALWFLAVLVIGKIVATSLSIAIGGSGGVFAPSLFMGAMVGSAFGIIAADISPSIAGSPGAYALVGMGAVFAGAARAPITAVIIMFELTGEYTIILPLMTAIVLATMISRYLSPSTIYTAKLRRRGVILGEDQSGVELLAQTISAREVMLPVPTSIKESMALSDIAVLLASSRNGVLPVTNEDGHYVGIVTARVVAEALADGRHDQSPASLVLESAATVKADAKLGQVIEALDLTGTAAIPVLDEKGDGVIGWVDYARTLRALRTSQTQ